MPGHNPRRHGAGSCRASEVDGPTRTKQPKILRAKMARRSNFDLDAALAELQAAMDAADESQVRRILFEVIEQSAS